MAENKATCGTCDYFEPTGELEGTMTGECHANPPQTVVILSSGIDFTTGGAAHDVHGYFPPTDEAKWCGQHSAKSRAQTEGEDAYYRKAGSETTKAATA